MFKKIYWGFCLIAIGILLLLANLEVLSIPGKLWNYWPVFLIMFGIYGILEKGSSKLFNIVIVLVGIAIILHNVFKFVNFWQILWPSALILIGISFIVPKFIRKEAFAASQVYDGEKFLRTDIFSGGNVNVVSSNLKFGSITSIFGGSEVHLENSIISEEGAVIDINVIFGGTEIFLPHGVSVESRGFIIFGGSEHKNKNLSPELNSSKKVILNLSGAFGGVEIHSI